MKRKAYMTTEELWDFAKIGVLAEEAKSIAERTSEKDWARKLKTISTYSQTIVTERLAVLDPKSIKPVLRRVNNSKLRFVSNDDVRVHPDRKHEPTITIDTEMLFDILDLAILSCFKCPQGGCVKECRWREIFHILSIEPMRIDVEDGECEYSNNKVGEAYAVTPQYKRVNIPDKQLKG